MNTPLHFKGTWSVHFHRGLVLVPSVTKTPPKSPYNSFFSLKIDDVRLHGQRALWWAVFSYNMPCTTARKAGLGNFRDILVFFFFFLNQNEQNVCTERQHNVQLAGFFSAKTAKLFISLHSTYEECPRLLSVLSPP